jgi:phytanoyl-CoA hydroxylase
VSSAFSQNYDERLEELEILGFTACRGVLAPDLVAGLTAEADELIARFGAGERSADFWCYDPPGGGLQVLYRVHNLEKRGLPTIVAAFSAGVLHDIAARFLGEVATSTVCAMVVKTPGVAGLPWHRDRVDVPAGRAINLSVYLDRSHVGNGCFEAVPGSHLLSDDAEVEQVRAAGPRVPVPAEAGDLLVHDVRLVHGSGDNPSDHSRRSVITEFAVPVPANVR